MLVRRPTNTPPEIECSLRAFGEFLIEHEADLRILAREQQRAQDGCLMNSDRCTVAPTDYVFRKGSVAKDAAEALQRVINGMGKLSISRELVSRLFFVNYANDVPESAAKSHKGPSKIIDYIAEQRSGKDMEDAKLLISIPIAAILLQAQDLSASALKAPEITIFGGGAVIALILMCFGNLAVMREQSATIKKEDETILVNLLGTAAAQMGFIDPDKSIGQIHDGVLNALRAAVVERALEQLDNPDAPPLCKDDARFLKEYRYFIGRKPTNQEREVIKQLEQPEVQEALNTVLSGKNLPCDTSASGEICWRDAARNMAVAPRTR